MDAQRFGYSVGQFFKKIDRTFDNISTFIRLSITISKWGCYIPQIKSRPSYRAKPQVRQNKK